MHPRKISEPARVARAPSQLDSDNQARAVPIFQSTSFQFKSAEHGAKLFELSQLGPIRDQLGGASTCYRPTKE